MMVMGPDDTQRKLLAAWRKMGPEDRHALLKFAEFLASHSTASPSPPPTEPLDIPKPEGESAVKALKRLKKSYPMIENDLRLLEEASTILMRKVTGSSDQEVVADLEHFFAKRYQQWQEARQGATGKE
ncbi:MAG: hypothetical protein HQL52_02180 [Magnetococcales bacterium]|nr:hypothetical protein [Magnetococcales bacterium]